MSGEVLFLAHRLPFPPDRGDKIRSHHVLKALAEIAPVHVGCFAETEADLAHEGKLSALAESHCMPRRSKPLWRAGLEALRRGRPVSFTAFHDAALAAWVEDTLARRDIAAIYVFSGQMGQYVPQGWAGRLVVDLVDVDSAKFEAYAAARRGPRRWIHAREGRLLRAAESDLAHRADRTLLVSQAEADMLRSRMGDWCGTSIEPLRNGIDFTTFDPKRVIGHQELARGGPHLVFTGQMDYPPNIAAVTRMARHILPRVREVFSDATFHIVGRAPERDVRALAASEGVRVWGEVADMRPFLKGADLVVAPLTIARGVQNKVLEAMAMARPVVLSPEAATGIEAQDGAHFRIAARDAAFADACLDLLADKDRAGAMGLVARDFVTATMSWPATLAGLPDVMGVPGAGGERDAA